MSFVHDCNKQLFHGLCRLSRQSNTSQVSLLCRWLNAAEQARNVVVHDEKKTSLWYGSSSLAGYSLLTGCWTDMKQGSKKSNFYIANVKVMACDRIGVERDVVLESTDKACARQRVARPSSSLECLPATVTIASTFSTTRDLRRRISCI